MNTLRNVRRLLCPLLAGLALASSSAVAQQQTGGDGHITVNLVVGAEVEEQRIFVLRYAIEPAAGERGQPPEQIQLCGGFDFPGATQTVSAETCEAGRTYTADLPIDAETAVALQLSTMKPTAGEPTFDVLMQTFDGEMPQSPEDFTVYPERTVHWVWAPAEYGD